MRTTRFPVAIASCLALALLGVSSVARVPAQDPATKPTDAAAEDPNGWPRSFDDEGVKFTVYQPQLEKWDDVRLIARSAVSVETHASPLPVFGVIWFDARTEVDKEERLVTLESITLRGSFPTAPDSAEAWLAGLRKHFPEMKTVALERLEASLAVLRAEQKAERATPLKNDAPRIIFSPRPSILVLIDGKPVLRRAGAGLLRVINSRALLLQEEKSSHFFLGVGDRWLEAASLDGPWTLAASAPEGAGDVKASAVASKLADLFYEDAEVTQLVQQGGAPTVFASTLPAELIETTGEPELVPLDGTKLLWVRNTDADVFVDTASNQYYVLVSGRWFRAPSREGPWTYVGARELPADFARIPEHLPAGEVLTSVPGTPQAAEAEIANNIPQTATVKRSEAKLQVTYDGEPQLKPIEGTRMSYAINSATPIILVGGRYYACQDGVWFTASSAQGPWVVADSVPAEIYSIPTSSPVHYVTYAHVYDSSPDYVYDGYTPGYLGTCLSDDGCVVWGTGWQYSPWIGGSWYGCPWTYGFGVGIRWNVGYGWSLGLGVGARVLGRPWWGPLSSPHSAFFPAAWTGSAFHTNMINANVYNHWQGGAVVHGQRFERTGGGRPNNVYASPDGRILRHTEGAWEHHENGAWQRSPAGNAEATRRAQQLESERRVRDQGARRAQTVHRAQPAPSQPHHQPAPQQHFRPQPSSPGLRGGTVRGGGGGGGGGHHR